MENSLYSSSDRVSDLRFINLLIGIAIIEIVVLLIPPWCRRYLQTKINKVDRAPELQQHHNKVM